MNRCSLTCIVGLCGFSHQTTNDKFILNIGAEVGGCLVDGLGDGVMVKAPGFEKGAVRSLCFGLLQVSQFMLCSSWRLLQLIATVRGIFSPLVGPMSYADFSMPFSMRSPCLENGV